MSQNTTRWEASPFDLAIFRVVVCALVLLFTDVSEMVAIASLPQALATNATWLPIAPRWTMISGYVLLLGCTFGLVGVLTRPALVLAAVASVYFHGVAQHVGAVVHHHHLTWFLALLAASPCADVLSVSAARRAAAGAPRPPRRALAYGIPVWTARALIAAIFFFPGVHKLAESGLAWVLSDNLRNQMYFKWFQHGEMAPWRIDRHPWVLRACAGAAVLFELSLPALLLSKRTRPWAAGAAFVFHMFTEVFMHIRFTALWPCYVVLLDAHDALRGLAAEVVPRKVVVATTPKRAAIWRNLDVFGRCIYRPPATTGRRTPAPWLPLLVAPLLLVPAVAYGALGITQAWPFACYPTFQWIAPDTIPHLAADAVLPDGTAIPIAFAPRSQKDWGVVWSVVGATHGPVDRERVRAYWQRRGRHVPDATAVRVYRAYSSVVPERYGQPPVQRELIAELACPRECAAPAGSRAH